MMDACPKHRKETPKELPLHPLTPQWNNDSKRKCEKEHNPRNDQSNTLWMMGQDETTTRADKSKTIADNNKLFVSEETYNSLDQCLDQAAIESDDLFSIVNLVQGQAPQKKCKITKDLKPIAYVRFNS